MPVRATIYRILVASPSDVTDERKAVPEAISAWNTANSYYRGIYLEPVLFETHASPEMGDRPQSIINRQLVDTCDILIGIFWTRIGTHTGMVESGTVEEIEEFRKAEKPVLLYFSSAPVVLENVNAGQFRKLLDFKEKCRQEGLTCDYDSIADLQTKLMIHITRTIDDFDMISDTNWIDKHRRLHGELPPLPDYLLPIAIDYAPGEPVTKNMQITIPSAQMWSRLLPSQQDELLELVEWLGQDRRDYLATMERGKPPGPRVVKLERSKPSERH